MTSDLGLRFRVVDALADLVEELALAGPVPEPGRSRRGGGGGPGRGRGGHLAHVFAKLGLTSRAQLAAEATRQEAP